MRIFNALKKRLRKVYNAFLRLRLRNTDITLVSSNCNGACILSDLHIPFRSPFVNLWVKPKDFVKFCENMPHYMECDLKFVSEEGISYPVGELDDIRVYFLHYSSEQEALTLWNKRKSRTDWRADKDKIYILLSERDGCSYDDLKRFDQLDFPHKVVFCHKAYPEIKSAALIPGFENEDCVGVCSDYRGRFRIKKYYDSFDYVSWFNESGTSS